MARRFLDQLMYGPDEPENPGDQDRAQSRTSSARQTLLWGDSQDIPPMKTPRGQAWRQQVLHGSGAKREEGSRSKQGIGRTLLYGDTPPQQDQEPQRKRGSILSAATAIATLLGGAAGEHERVLEDTRRLREEKERKELTAQTEREAAERAQTPEGREEAQQALAMITTMQPSPHFDDERIRNLRAYVMSLPEEQRPAAALAQFERIQQENERREAALREREAAEEKLRRYEVNPLDTSEWAANYNRLSETYAGEVPDVPEGKLAYVRQQAGLTIRAAIARTLFGNIAGYDPDHPEEGRRRRRRYEPDDQLILEPDGLRIINLSGGVEHPDEKFFPWEDLRQLEFSIDGLPWLKWIDAVRARFGQRPFLIDDLGQVVVTATGRTDRYGQELARVPLPKPGLFLEEIRAARDAAEILNEDPQMPLRITPRDFIQLPIDTRAGQGELLQRQTDLLQTIAQAMQGMQGMAETADNRQPRRDDSVEVPLSTIAAWYRQMQDLQNRVRRAEQDDDDSVIDGTAY